MDDRIDHLINILEAEPERLHAAECSTPKKSL